MPKKYDQEIKARAVRMVRDHMPTYGSVTNAAEAVGPQIGISGNTLRRWVVQADVDDGVCDGVPSEVQAELARLQLRTGGCARRTRSCAGRRFSSRGSSTPALVDLRVHRHAGQRGLRRRDDLHGPHR